MNNNKKSDNNLNKETDGDETVRKQPSTIGVIELKECAYYLSLIVTLLLIIYCFFFLFI